MIESWIDVLKDEIGFHTLSNERIANLTDKDRDPCDDCRCDDCVAEQRDRQHEHERERDEDCEATRMNEEANGYGD
jgi:hypothetical protein